MLLSRLPYFDHAIKLLKVVERGRYCQYLDVCLQLIIIGFEIIWIEIKCVRTLRKGFCDIKIWLKLILKNVA